MTDYLVGRVISEEHTTGAAPALAAVAAPKAEDCCVGSDQTKEKCCKYGDKSTEKKEKRSCCSGGAESAKDNRPQIVVLYGSSKGCAADLSARVSTTLQECIEGANVQALQSMDDFEPENLSMPMLVVFVVATYENGAPPENAKFMYGPLAHSIIQHGNPPSSPIS
jgi:sulfite reductase alpha subunit-like flavoprotein